ncbi:hypothetical protein [Paenibacillus harenae]|uniref:Uncharacterized protein n=1 Tax=Paenibacillus harenae TaxID=306543 RepID=A0ABT9TXK9_PAEHA|nr:hypothetical protein [Paenibacillus harenae]MDQ0112097.1 hypothetical protein [Paenibacillus harenae]
MNSLYLLRARIKHEFDKEKQAAKKKSAAMNSMAPNEREIIRLGMDMKHMKTNSEIMEEGLVPDPIQ